MTRRTLNVTLALLIAGAAIRGVLADRQMLTLAKDLIEAGKLSPESAQRTLSLAKWGAFLNWAAIAGAAFLGLKK